MKALDTIEKYLLTVTIILVPLFALSIFANPFDTAKSLLLTLLVGLTVLVKTIKLISSGEIKLASSKLDRGVIALGLTYLISGALMTPNKMEAFFVPGTALQMFLLTILFFLITANFGGRTKSLVYTLGASITLVAIVSTLAKLGVLAKIPQLPALFRDLNFSPVGGKLPEILIYVATLPMFIFAALSERELVKKALWSVASVVVILASFSSITSILPGKQTAITLVDVSTSWGVSVDSIKESPILGVGPGNYLTAFNRFRSVNYNYTDLWNLRFSSGASFVLTLIAEVGLLGLLVYMMITFLVVTTVKRQMADIKVAPLRLETGVTFSLILSFIGTYLFPANLVVMFTFFVLLAAWVTTTPVDISFGVASKLPATVVSLPILAILIALAYSGTRATLAEVKFKSALDAISKNDGKLAYDSLRDSINTNPYVDRYHASYAQVNVALARSIAAKGATLTDAERETVAQLIQQAIREGKAAASLNQSRAANWEVLARTYQAIMAFAQGADGFAVQAYSQAVALDPINPNLRIALGGVYYALGRYDDSIRILETAAVAKSDLANTYYNLSASYREKRDFARAVAAMETVLTLVEVDSPDYQLATQELTNLKARRDGGDSEGTQNLIPPQEAEEPAIVPPLELPEDASPPETEEVVN